MPEFNHLLHAYLHGVLRLSGAVSASLFIPGAAGDAAQPVLLHAGEEPPLDELSDLAGAEQFAARARRTGGGSESLGGMSPDTFLIPLRPASPRASGLRHAPDERRRRSWDAVPETPEPVAWLGLRFGPGETSGELPPARLSRQLGRADPGELWSWLLQQGGGLAREALEVSAVLRDPVSGLPNRQVLQSTLATSLEAAQAGGRPLSLLLINPDDFHSVNDQFGREAGDRVVGELASRLRASLRHTDFTAKYGGVVHAVLLLDTPLAAARQTAEKVRHRLTEAAFLDGATRLGVSIGIASYEPGDPGISEPLDLIRRADQALHAAKRAGGSQIAVWEESWKAEEIGNLDRLTGLFTGNLARDYRNMVLLWDAVNAMAAYDDAAQITAPILDRMYTCFLPDRLALVKGEDGQPHVIRGISHGWQKGGTPRALETGDLSAGERELLAKGCREPRTLEASFPQPGAEDPVEPIHAYTLPLTTSSGHLGCLYLASSRPLDPSDLLFLKALAAQLALALDRARLAEQERRRQEQERQRLEAELAELRQALQHARMEYLSPQMESVLATARRVAPTDATILITGESGTGKELLASVVHELSDRRDKPLIVVDCGAIAASLADSELFGHERGAYTGAQERSIGRLAAAEGGTVLLDEIGELPLEVQSKLLRFVQEKQLTPVGGTRPRRVNVRIIAATNRDLESEVAHGRFRGDLYYRLKVVHLQVPPLRTRPDDTMHLARHYLRAYATLFQKGVRRFSPQAEALMLQHAWPGNVRELQNRIMQAVILCESEEVGATELGLPARSESAGFGPQHAESLLASPRSFPARPAEPLREPLPPSASPWDDLRAALGRQVAQAMDSGTAPSTAPLGRWLRDDLFLAAHAAATGIARRGAALIGVPETTFRTHQRRIVEQEGAGRPFRPTGWEAVREALRSLIAHGHAAADGDLLEQVERVLLAEILARMPDDHRAGPALLGVTPPTFKRRVAVLRALPAPPDAGWNWDAPPAH